MDVQAQVLRGRLLEELAWEPKLGASRLDVTVAHDGVVTLTGIVGNYAEKVAAERAVKRVKGVHVLVNDVDVKLPTAHARTDPDLAEAIAQAFERDILIPHDRIEARVAEGWVRLVGDVQWNYQKTAAEEAVHRLTGVLGITNLLAVTPPLSDADASAREHVRERIRAALERRADVEARDIDIEAQEGRVVLRGRVHSWAEREAAEAAAWAAPGVATVEDRLDVSS